MNFRKIAIVLGLLVGSALSALAANTVFFTSKGDVVIGLTPTTLDGVNVGNTTRGTGKFTTGDFSGALTGAGVTGIQSAPGPIGSVTPNTGAFTTLNASDQITSSAGAPTIASGACGATTNGTVAGTNQSGKITIGSASTSTCTVSFSKTLAAPNSCVIAPASTGAAAQETTHAYVSSISTAGFVVTGTLASTVYYFICL